MIRRLRLIVSGVCTALLVAGCGGGGDGDGGGIGTLNIPVESSVSAYAQSAHQFNLSGAGGVSIAYAYTPNAAAVFEGLLTNNATESATLFLNGMQIEQVVVTSFFSLNPYRFLGSSNATSYSVFNQVTNLPATARIGDTGNLGTDTEYADATKTQVVGTSSVTWSMEADSPTTALFCVNTATTSGPVTNGSQCYRVNANGTVLGLVIRLLVNGQTVTLG